ncbi:MAG: type II secretion system protein [Planctomycetes bacterium]|nr:type II secretion system protein [Planctomycetota bacterium]
MTRVRSAFTLIELLVVVAIIMLLASLLLPMIVGSQDAMDKATALELVQGLQQAMKMEKVSSKGYPYPDNLAPLPTDPALKRIGFFIYDPTEENPGMINTIMDSQGYTFDYTHLLTDDNLVCDPWGQPINYVLGDYKNRIGIPAYDEDLPQDLNKPKDVDIKAEESDWNPTDRGKHAYIWSEGPEQLEETWIFHGD